MEELAKHILANAVVFIDEYSKKEILTEYEKGILQGLWMCSDSIKNHFEMEKLKFDIDIDKIMDDLRKLMD